MNTYSGAAMQHLDSNKVATDKKMDAFIAPYAEEINSKVQEVIGYTAKAMAVQKPESDLGNLLSDYLLKYSIQHIDHDIDMALFNTGGFRIPLPPGEIKVRHIMEIMPFDNTLVVVNMSGANLNELVKQIIAAGGDPVAAPNGISIISESDTIRFSLNGKAVYPKQMYKVVTSNYLADGGDRYTVLASASSKFDSGILVRDAIEEAFRLNTTSDNRASSDVEGRIIIR